MSFDIHHLKKRGDFLLVLSRSKNHDERYRKPIIHRQVIGKFKSNKLNRGSYILKIQLP